MFLCPLFGFPTRIGIDTQIHTCFHAHSIRKHAHDVKWIRKTEDPVMNSGFLSSGYSKLT
jgi:hypothetical protein